MENIRLVTEKVKITECEKFEYTTYILRGMRRNKYAWNEQMKLMNALSLEKQLHLDVQMEYSEF